MKWRHWAVLIVLVLLNYIIFSVAFTQLAVQRRALAHPTRTLQPTFSALDSQPIGWIVLPTSTAQPTRTPISPTPTAALDPTPEITSTAEYFTTDAQPTPEPPTVTPTPEPFLHTVAEGESLSIIAQKYGVTVETIAQANGLTDTSLIVIGQQLIIPGVSQTPPTATPVPQPTNTPVPSDTPKPAATKRPTPKPTQPPPPPTATAGPQYTAELIWDPLVAPNCSGPTIAKQSIIRDGAGNPINGARVEVNCYGNVWLSHPSGTPGEYDPGHYDFSFGQNKPQDWTCTARVFDVNGQPVASSEVATIQFDTNDCRPDGNGHQAAIVNWIRHW